MAPSINFFVASDDKQNMGILQGMIKKIFPQAAVFTGKDGLYAQQFLRKQNLKLIVIADKLLPNIGAMQLAKTMKAEKKTSGHFMIMVNEQNDPESNLKAIKYGIDEVIYKPFMVDQLIRTFRNAERYLTLRRETAAFLKEIDDLKSLLAKSADDMKALVSKFMQIKMPELDKQIPLIEKASVWIAKELVDSGLEILSTYEIEKIATAAKLCMVGKMFLPDTMISTPVMTKGYVKNRTMSQVPEFAKDVLSRIRNFEDVIKIIYHIYENYDGTGIPNSMQAQMIPVGSRILRVVLDYYEEFNKSSNQTKAFSGIEHEMFRLYDFRVVTFLDQFFALHGSLQKTSGMEDPMKPDELEEHMYLTRHIVTKSGKKIASSGTLLDEENILKIKTILHDDPVIGRIYVRSKKAPVGDKG